MVQWLRLYVVNARGLGLIPGQRTKVPPAIQCGQRKKRDSIMSWLEIKTGHPNILTLLVEVLGKY